MEGGGRREERRGWREEGRRTREEGCSPAKSIKPTEFPDLEGGERRREKGRQEG